MVRAEDFSPEYEGSKFLGNIGVFLQVYTALQSKRPTPTYPLP
jgi:hypothetical protein